MKIFEEGISLDFLDEQEQKTYLAYVESRLEETWMCALVAYNIKNMNLVQKYINEIHPWVYLYNFYYSNGFKKR